MQAGRSTDHADLRMAATPAHRGAAPLRSGDRFPVDGARVTVRASMKGTQPKAGKTAPDGDPLSPPAIPPS